MPVDDAPTERQLGNRRWLILGGVVLALVAIAVIIAIGASGDDEDRPEARAWPPPVPVISADPVSASITNRGTLSHHARRSP